MSLGGDVLRGHMAMNLHREPAQTWLEDINPHVNDVNNFLNDNSPMNIPQ